MITIKTTGDDAWETDRRILEAIRFLDFKCERVPWVNPISGIKEIMTDMTWRIVSVDTGDTGKIGICRVLPDNTLSSLTYWVDPTELTVMEVL